MMKPTLKTLWLTGGAVLAAWLAVTPPTTAPGRSAATDAGKPAPVRAQTADDLDAQEARLRRYLDGVPLRASTRNPFRFAAKRAAETAQRSAAAGAPASMPAAPAQPSLSLSGIAEQKTPQGVIRTAVISGEGQLYLVTEGEQVGTRYRVARVESDAVVLRDETGTDIRLVLH